MDLAKAKPAKDAGKIELIVALREF